MTVTKISSPQGDWYVPFSRSLFRPRERGMRSAGPGELCGWRIICRGFPRRVCWASMFSLRVEGSYFRGWSQQKFPGILNGWCVFTKECGILMIIAMRWPLFWRPQVDEPLYDIRIVSWQVWTYLSFFFEHQWKKSAKGEPRVTRQFPNSCSASRRLRSAYLKRWRPNRCGHPLCFCCRRKKIGHVRWELSMIVSATSRSPARKRTLGYEKKNEKNAPSQCGCFQK